MKFLLIIGFLSAIIFGQETPATMIKLAVRVQSPEIPEDSFAAKPKVMYRAGNRYCRTEEMPDRENLIHGLMIINEPDIWMVNLFPKIAQHLTDPGPTFNCRMPIFVYGDEIKSAGDMNQPLFELEFGRELTYFTGRGATPKQGPVLRGKATMAYSTEVGDSLLLLFTTGTPEQPWAVIRQRGKTREIIWYGVYEQLPFDPKLFGKPEGVKIEDAKQ
jgi:hypothetical protein